MSKVEVFENAPVGATATHPVSGSRALKVNDGDQYWITQWGSYLSDVEMGLCDYTLDPLEPAPTTAREALDLAWKLGHEVRPGQVIPEGARYLTYSNSEVKEHTAQRDIKIRSAYASSNRTVEPLPTPEPDWLDAPAVIAVHDSYTAPSIWGKHWDQERLAEYYQSALTAGTAHWSELRDVVPLYSKGQDQ